ncbi:hypothetical protein LC613_03665 [Nostoc sphaeroides CHAB 2801]|uniref:hypothetical protein n=1 Tax=Nostoc sphaeroides TaxID=446679 RepID=UPI001E61C1BF|nr:hypothetical protein [Nostoc sphaeroides]MCC5627308.1 hypothetical protein [Nostoc sphaeroides CHAB 2801]
MVQSIGRVNKYTDTDLNRFAEDLNRDGICVIRGLFDQELISEWAKAFENLFRERQNQPGGLAPREIARYYLTLPWVSPFANVEVFANPVIMGVLERVFFQEYVMVQLGVDSPSTRFGLSGNPPGLSPFVFRSNSNATLRPCS